MNISGEADGLYVEDEERVGEGEGDDVGVAVGLIVGSADGKPSIRFKKEHKSLINHIDTGKLLCFHIMQ